MGIVTRDKDGNRSTPPQGRAADPVRPNVSDSVEAADADETEEEESEQESSKPVREARRPPTGPPPFGGGGKIGGGGGEGTPGDGFFHIRKKGQGYWTRMGTAGGAALIGALTVNFLWTERLTFNLGDTGAELLCAIFAVAYGILVFYIMNRQTSVDFLIATDSEMKKVNWTTRAELMGSTKVVILFMFVIAAYLFIMDVFFGYLFYFIGVVKEKPF
jgi:preprotein translocase subunit SecE